MTPAVSVLLPFRDAERTIEDAIRSVLEPDVEIIAVDDDSSDGSKDVVASIADPRIRLLSSRGSGLVASLETARSAARAPLLARMDADDISLPGRLTKQRAEMGDAAVLATQVELFGDVADGMTRYITWQNRVLTSDEHRNAMFVESPVCHPTVMMRRDAIAKVGGYRDGDFPEDYDLWLRIDQAGLHIRKLPQVLLRWRVWDRQATKVDRRYRQEAFIALKVGYLAQRLRKQKRPLVVWGAGQTGRHVMRAAELHGLVATAWIDIDPKKIGGERRAAPIRGLDSLTSRDNQFLLVAVGAAGARDEVRQWLDQRSFREGEDYLCVA